MKKITHVRRGAIICALSFALAGCFPEDVKNDPTTETSTLPTGRATHAATYHGAYASAAHLDILYPDYFAAHLDACEDGLSAMIAEADGIYINGGDQVRTFEALVTFDGTVRQNSAELAQILDRHAAGDLVVGGTSAGAAVQGGGRLLSTANVNPMVTAGSPHTILKNGYNADSAELTGGMGVFSWGVTDTHFSERARETRLIRLLDHADVRLGFGVDETTALNVRHEENAAEERRVVMTVSGQSGVFVVDYATAQTVADAPFETRYVTTHYLHQGDQLVWYPATETYDIYLSADRTALTVGKSGAAVSTDDVLYQTDYRDLTRAMFNAEAAEATGTSYESDPQYQVQLRATQKTRAFKLGNQISYAYVEVDISHNNAQ